ncbi:MAG: molecular chaperone HtpG [Pseudomonadota bacterium]
MSNAQKKTEDNKQNFSADVSRLLDIVANALYTNNDVFLRELISNAADACDKLRYEAIQKPELISDQANFRIHVYKDTNDRTVTLVDNGIGMSKAELADNLGTIAKSGTAKLMETVNSAKEGSDKLKLIGQFGVGFYASYMVAHTVTVASRKAGSKTAWAWESDGATGFELRKPTAEEEAALDGERGTAIILHIKDDASDFLINEKIKQTVEQYSDHIDVKILLNTPEETDKGEGQPINSASAIWTRSKDDITDEQYTEFYKHITFGMDEPLLTSHWKAEGTMEFTGLLFVPTLRPWDLYDPSRKNSVKLYVRRVFITDELPELMFPWLRFVRGVIDSEDLPLNISRESLQHNPILNKIRSSVARKILGDLDKLSRDDAAAFESFWGQFGPAVKEGLYDAADHRDAIFKICRFFSTHEDGAKHVSLADYIERMKDGQKEIYYISGENVGAVKNSPQLEGFKAKGYEVLFFTDTIDDFWLQQSPDYKEFTFKSITKGDVALDDEADEQDNETSEEEAKEQTELLSALAKVLSDDIDHVRFSKRLTDSPVCLIAPDGGVDLQMERVLKIQQKYAGPQKPVLEINKTHPLIEKIGKIADAENTDFKDAAALLLDQARIIQGEPLKDAAGFVKKMSALMEKSL